MADCQVSPAVFRGVMERLEKFAEQFVECQAEGSSEDRPKCSAGGDVRRRPYSERRGHCEARLLLIFALSGEWHTPIFP